MREVSPAIAENMWRAVAPSLQRRVRPLIVRPFGGAHLTGAHQGSAIVLSVGDRYFLLTAGHNLVIDGFDKIEVGLLPVGVEAVHADSVLWLDGILITRVESSDGTTADFAFGELPTELVLRLRIEATPLARVSQRPPQPGEMVLVFGYPTALALDMTAADRPYTPRYILFGTTCSEPPNDLVVRYEPRHNIFVDYPTAEGAGVNTFDRSRMDTPASPATLPDPVGVSGGGIWMISDHEGVFSPDDLYLAGIIHHRVGSRSLIANHAALVVGNVLSAAPELQSELEQS